MRDSFFSSGDEEMSLAGLEGGIASCFEEEMESRLSERGGGPEPAEETDMLRLSDLLVADSTDRLCESGASNAGASNVSCSTVNGLAWRFSTPGSEDSVLSSLGGGSRMIRAVTETDRVVRFALELDWESRRRTLDARENASGVYAPFRDGGVLSGLGRNDTEARFRRASKEEEAEGAVRFCDDGGIASRLPENFSKALIRFEIPDDTLIFFATRTGLTGLVISECGVDTDRPMASACMLGMC